MLSLNFRILKEIKKCYFEKFNVGYKSIFNKRYIKKFINKNKTLALGNLVLLFLDNEKKKKYKNPKNSAFYKHYIRCKNCKLECPLAQLDFIIDPEK